MKLAGAIATLLLAAIGDAAHGASPAREDRALHDRLVTLDTHLDSPYHFGRAGWDITARHALKDDRSQLDLPRMVEGGLDGGFFVIYTKQGPLTSQGYASALDHALKRAIAIRALVSRHPGKFELAFSPADARRIAGEGKHIVYQSIENSYPIGTDLGLLSTFHGLGVRMAGPVHFKNNQFTDSATDKPGWNGLSPLGRLWVTEMNRLGMLIDASHASDQAFDQMMALSKTPIILSHSGSRTIFDHPRNLDDERLRRLAASGGVIQITTVYLMDSPPSAAREALYERQDGIDKLSPAEQSALISDFAALDAIEPEALPTFDQFLDSLLHALKVAGVDHVGIGADWDGGGGLTEMPDVAGLPKITSALKAAGYSDTDIGKIWSGNILRVLEQAQAYAKDAAWGR